MNKKSLIFFLIFLIELSISTYPERSDRHQIYLPMKKDHKYGEDICYYREIDQKLDYAVYYVKPCEKGKYCEEEISRDQPFGFCREVPVKSSKFPSFGEACSSSGECQNNLYCDGTCKKKCSNTLNPYEHDLNTFACEANDYKKIDEKYCKWYDARYNEVANQPKYYLGDTLTLGKFPGLPKECGIIRYTPITDYDRSNSDKAFTRYFKQSEEWCSIGEAKDGDFVNDQKFCKSGFALNFYPNGGLDDPSEDFADSIYEEHLVQMCVTPTEIDLNNPLVGGCVITYKVGDGNEQKYNAAKYNFDCEGLDNIVIQTKIYTEFIEEFNNASDEDKNNCYGIPDNDIGAGDCENIKLLKLYYFYNHINEYIFYQDRDKLDKVLHYKIQQAFHRYYEASTYLNIKYLIILLFLILI